MPSFRSSEPPTPSHDGIKLPNGASAVDCGSASDSRETPEQLERRRTTGSCGFYPSKFKECAEPRSCYDCLNFVVKTEEGGCMVSEYGSCVPARDNYSRARDFRCAAPANPNTAAARNASANSSFVTSGGLQVSDVGVSVVTTAAPVDMWWYHFPATSVQYCERTDPQCTECRRTVFADYIEGMAKSGGNRFCYGERGCVCIATCEALRDKLAPSKDCFAKALAASMDEKEADDDDGGASGMSSVFMILGAMAFVVATVFAIYRIRSTSERRLRSECLEQCSDAQAAGAVTTPDTGSSPAGTAVVAVATSTAADSARVLHLFGWQAMREDAIGQEHLGVEIMSPVKHSTVQFVRTEPSAPELDTAVPTAPVAAMAIPVPMAVLASASAMVSLRATASAPDFEDMAKDDAVVL
ncbi:hypothetical protein PybrP1_009761 [[Pythium] brassicae (nom. inval.)]|nr:hypothetical protein PybrP1_009761 [[Pythium] brassicae (nom. inval.)]